MGFDSKISRLSSRNWRIHSGSFFIAEISLTISRSIPLRALNTGSDCVRKSYLLISPIGSAVVSSTASDDMFFLLYIGRSNNRLTRIRSLQSPLPFHSAFHSIELGYLH